MLKQSLKRLERLHSDVERALAISEAGGREHTPSSSSKPAGARYSRRPHYRGWAIEGTRPQSDRGVTFHFKHSFVSKGNSMSKGYQDMTAAPAHQSYIERASAAETIEFATPDGTRTREISFGNIGRNKADRTEFWRIIERSEGKSARVQCRIIAELPCEVDGPAREGIVRDFCQEFEGFDFPYWVVVHAPDKHNDKRNYHAHIAYHDRPAKRLEGGRWDFEITTERRYANGTKRKIRPYKQNKVKEAQGPKWIRHLRRRWADICNSYLAAAKLAKRYDPRSYRESGVPKQPTYHLGTQAAYAEYQGIDTELGKINAQRETAFRLSRRVVEFMKSSAYMSHFIERLRRQHAKSKEERQAKDEALDAARQHYAKSEEGAAAARRREAHQIAAEAASRRLIIRSQYLEGENQKLLVRPIRGKDIESMDFAQLLFREQLMVEEALFDLTPFAENCRNIVRTQDQLLARISSEQEALAKTAKMAERKFLTLASGAPLEAAEAFAEDYQAAMDLQFKTTSKSFGARRSNESSHAEPRDPEGEQPAASTKASRRPDANPNLPEFIEDSILEENRAIQDIDIPDSAIAALNKQQAQDLARVFEDWSKTEAADDQGAVGPESQSDAASRKSGMAEVTLPRTAETAGASQNLKTEKDADGPPSQQEAPKDLPTSRMAEGLHPEGSFAGAYQLSEMPEAREIRDLEDQLGDLTNAELRFVAFATRDGADLTENEVQARRYANAYVVIQEVSRRRGLDLESGIHHPEKATDLELARQHMDSAVVMLDPRQRHRIR